MFTYMHLFSTLFDFLFPLCISLSRSYWNTIEIEMEVLHICVRLLQNPSPDFVKNYCACLELEKQLSSKLGHWYMLIA